MIEAAAVEAAAVEAEVIEVIELGELSAGSGRIEANRGESD